jgi:cullin 1
MFSYLTDKDLFAEIYRYLLRLLVPHYRYPGYVRSHLTSSPLSCDRNQLAKRLLNQRSASDEMERLMIGKLKLRYSLVRLSHRQCPYSLYCPSILL